MQLEPFLNFVMRRPFRPFHVRMVDGRRITVTHPESVTVYAGGLGFWRVLPSGQLEFIEGDAVTALQSADIADTDDFPSAKE